MTTLRSAVVRLSPLLVCAAVATPALAQSTSTSEADRLFAEGRRSLDAKDYSTACRKLRASARLQMAVGTLYSLASCEEASGALVSAREHFQAAADYADATKDRLQRGPVARARVQDIDKRIPRLTLRLAVGAPTGSMIERDGVDVGTLDLSRPTDPGKHTVVVSAPRCADSSSAVELKEGDDRVLDLMPRCSADDIEKGDREMAAARSASAGPERDRHWNDAAAAYERALLAAPAARDAPAAAINGAYGYKQVRRISDAIRLYRILIDEYGSDENLSRLQNGNGRSARPQPDAYQERLKYLGMAYDALAASLMAILNYPRAADTFAAIAANQRFDVARRANAARIAMVLYVNLGDRYRANETRAFFLGGDSRLSSQQRAEVEMLWAMTFFDQWDPAGGNSGPNAAARYTALDLLQAFHTRYKGKPEAARYTLQASYRITRLLRETGDAAYPRWLQSTIDDWEFFKAHAPASGGRADESPYSDWAAEADYSLIDSKMRGAFDDDPGRHRYADALNARDVVKAVDDELGQAEKTWRPLLENVATKYGSFAWAAAATARIGSLYDAIRSGLDLARPRYFTPEQQAKLDKLQKIVDQLSAAGQQTQADQVQANLDKLNDDVRKAWRRTKDQYMELCNQKMVSRYVTAALVARKWNVHDPIVQNAVARLAFFTDYLGEDKLKSYVEQTPDPSEPGRQVAYTTGMFREGRARGGFLPIPPSTGRAAPLPVAP